MLYVPQKGPKTQAERGEREKGSALARLYIMKVMYVMYYEIWHRDCSPGAAMATTLQNRIEPERRVISNMSRMYV